MSEPIFDIDERLYEMYNMDCEVNQVTPTIRDFLIWCDEQDYNLPEVWDMDRFDPQISTASTDITEEDE